MRMGRIYPNTRNSQIAEAKAHATCVPILSSRARLYIRTHHRRMDVVRKKPAISHQPPSFKGGKMVRPHLASGGSRDSQNSRRMNSIGFQFTDASMLRPMIS